MARKTGYIISGTKAGSRKAMETIKARYGVTRDGKSALHVKIGEYGGKASTGGGFASMDADKHLEASRKGGKASRRTKADYEKALQA